MSKRSNREKKKDIEEESKGSHRSNRPHSASSSKPKEEVKETL